MSTPSSAQIATSRTSFRGYFVKSWAWLNWRGLTKIVVTTVGLSARPRRISERWPSWSQPIVGTRPTGRDRSARTIEGRVAKNLVDHVVIHSDRLGRAGERARFDIRPVGPGGGQERFAQVGVRPGVAGVPLLVAEQVGQDLDLAAAAGPGADPDRGDLQPFGDRGGQLLWDELEDHRERARLLERPP